MKNLYEVFEEFEKAPKKEDKINILRNNKSYALECVLRGAFHPNVRYVIDEIPNYRKSDAPAGLGYTSIHQELGRVYLFEENNPKVAPTLTLDRKKVILAQMLETLEEKEAAVFAGMIMKRLPVKGLTYKLTQEAFPGLLPDVP
jgi:hypothetical protein